MNAVWTWLRSRAWPWLVSTALLLLGAGWLWRRRAAKREREVQQRVDLQTIRDRVTMLREQRRQLEQANVADEIAVKRIDIALEENRQELERAHNVGELSDAEVMEEFARLGF